MDHLIARYGTNIERDGYVSNTKKPVNQAKPKFRRLPSRGPYLLILFFAKNHKQFG